VKLQQVASDGGTKDRPEGRTFSAGKELGYYNRLLLMADQCIFPRIPLVWQVVLVMALAAFVMATTRYVFVFESLYQYIEQLNLIDSNQYTEQLNLIGKWYWQLSWRHRFCQQQGTPLIIFSL